MDDQAAVLDQQQSAPPPQPLDLSAGMEPKQPPVAPAQAAPTQTAPAAPIDLSAGMEPKTDESIHPEPGVLEKAGNIAQELMDMTPEFGIPHQLGGALKDWATKKLQSADTSLSPVKTGVLGVLKDIGATEQGVNTPSSVAIAGGAMSPAAPLVGLGLFAHGSHGVVSGWGDLVKPNAPGQDLPWYDRLDPDVVGNVANSAAEAIGGATLAGESGVRGVKAIKTRMAEKAAVQAPVAAMKDFMTAIPPSKTAPYNEADYNAARPYMEEQHSLDNISSPEETEKALNKSLDKIENHISSLIASNPDVPIKTSPIDAIRQKLSQNPDTTFLQRGLDSLERFKLGYERAGGVVDPPLTLETADKLRWQLNQEMKGVLKKNNYDVATARAVDPGFAASEAATEALRDGVYRGLKDLGYDGIDALRLTEGSIIKLRNAANRQMFKGEKPVASTGKVGPIRNATGNLIRMGGAAAGGSIGGGPGAVIGQQIGDTIARTVTGANPLTRNQLIERSFSHQIHPPEIGTPETGPIDLGAETEENTVGQPPMKVAEPAATGGNFSGALNEGSKAANTPDWVAGEFSHEIDRLEKIVRNPESTAEEKAIAGHQLQHTRELAEHIVNPNQGAAEVAPASNWTPPVGLEKGIPRDEAVETKIPLSKLSMSENVYNGANTDIFRGRGSKTQGPISVVYNPDNGQYLIEDGQHRVVEAHQRGDTTIPAKIWSGYSDTANVHGDKMDLSPETSDVAPASTVSKMPYDMSYDELDDAIKKEQSKGDDIEKELFGEEDAKRYAKLQRTANSSNAERADAASDEIAKMEDSLTKEQQDRLFGIGEPKSPSVEDLKDFKSALGGVGGWDNAADLGTSLRYAFSRLGNADLSDLSSLSHSEQVAYATLREGFKQAAEEGFDPNEVMQAGLKGAAERFAPEDADFMLKNFVKKNAPETSTVPVLGSKLHFAASKAGLEYKGPLEGGNGQVFHTFDDPTKPGDQITVRESELPATGVADFLKQKMEEKRSAPVGGGKTIEDLRKELLAQTTPKTTTKLLDVPEKLLPKGMNAKSVLNHEIGHMVVGDALGVSQKDIISHLHDDIPEGSAAAARYDPESLGGDARGYYPRGVLEKAFGEKLVPLYTAGGVAQELIEGIPFTENEGTTGDLAILHSVGRELGFSKSQIQDMIEAGKVKAKNILTKPGVLDTINKYASEREIGLSDTLHMSPERVQEMLKGLKKEPNETKNTQANIGRSSKVVPQADFGTTGASSKGNLREGNGKAIQTVNPSAAAGLSALAGSKVASGKSAQPETEEESEAEPLDLSAGMEAKEQDIPALLSKASKDYGIPEDLLYAQAMQESKMNPNAESNKGAKGVMQLMDQTSRSLGVTDPKDPAQNVDGGARLMKQLLDRFNGDQEKALASYDWNPTSVDKAVQEHGHSWLSYTPKETQTYVRKIMSEKYKQK